MSIAGNVKSLLQIKVKPRYDSYSDQFHRVAMVKVLMASSMLLGLNWFKDTITCIVPGTAEMDRGYVQQACWIQGVYIYKELNFDNHKSKWYEGHYGFSNNLMNDGMFPDGTMCNVEKNGEKCKALTKTFYLHYQWFPFYVALLALLYYLPYIFFRLVNNDMITLKDSLKSIEINPEDIIKNYFNYQINPTFKMNLRVFGNVLIKLSYLAVNVIAFVATDQLLHGEFKNYGSEWVKWSRLGQEEAYDYTMQRKLIRPGEILLPTFALCDVFEYASDVKYQKVNEHRFVCEISQNVLYHYVLMILWFAFIVGMIVSCLGFLIFLMDHVITAMCLWAAMGVGNQTKRVYHILTLRECEYLEFIRRKNMLVYGHVIRALKVERLDRYTVPSTPGSMEPDETCEKLMRDTMF